MNALPQHDPAWLERMYDNRALVPDFADYLHRWAEESSRARQAAPCWLDLAYGQAPEERLDVFPAPEPDAPVMVFIHGGWWRTWDKAEHSFVAAAFARAGVCVVVPNYALCPGTAERPVAIPLIARQMEKALAWVWRHVGQHGGDRRRITLVGHSAGGHLAALLLASPWPLLAPDLPEGLVQNALSISGVHDLTPIMYTPFLQQDVRLTHQQVMRMSPALLPAPVHGPLYCAVGALESAEFVRQCQLMQHAWGAHKVPRTTVLPGRHHFSVLDALVQPGDDLHHMALNLLRM